MTKTTLTDGSPVTPDHRKAQAERLKHADLSDTPTRQSRRRKARGKPF